MGVSYEAEGDTLIVYVPKELDHHSAKEVREYSEEVLKGKEVKNIVFDFSGTVFMDSSGVGMIMGRYRVVKERGGYIGVRGACAAIHRILELSGLYKLVRVCG